MATSHLRYDLLLKQWQGSSPTDEKDESLQGLASHVDIVLRRARSFVEQPEQKRQQFTVSLQTFLKGLSEAEVALEQIFDEATPELQELLESAHQELGRLSESSDLLHELLDEPCLEALTELQEEMDEPVARLLELMAELERRSETQPALSASSQEMIRVPESISKLYCLTLELGQGETDYGVWLAQIQSLQHTYARATQELKKHLARVSGLGARAGSCARYYELMHRGAQEMVDALQQMRQLSEGESLDVLDGPWVKLISGYRTLKFSGDQIARTESV